MKVTKTNLKSVYGILRKFFMSETHGCLIWYNFDCGKRKIKPYLNARPKYYDKPINFELETDMGEPFIRIDMDNNHGYAIDIGDELKLQSGKIRHKQEWFPIAGKNYVYTVFQSCKPTQELIEQKRHREMCNDFEYREMHIDFEDNLYNFKKDLYDEMGI